ncbi:IS4 family transposase [Candidatus Woesearchaeota archaeon]|nr:IS4 family transposase [Candidatus Woesearchaeota archaeon]
MKKKLTSKEFIERHRIKPTDFTRERSLPFHKVFFLLINFLTKSLQSELDNLFRVLLNKEIPVNEVTKGAFSLARKKLNYKAFVELDKTQIDYFYETAAYTTWNGFRLLGVDGSTVRLPSSCEIVKKYGIHDTSETGTPITYARLSQAYDLLNNLTVDAKLSTYDDNEHNLALQHAAIFEAGDLVLYDRNYASFWMFSLLIQKKTHFCARLKVGSWKVAKELANSGKKEMITEIYPSKASAKKCKALGLATTPIKLRFICIELDTGEKEVLITSLTDESQYPYEVFCDLYQLRWQVEESYKTMKSRLEIENFSGKSCLAIAQDFYAKIFSCNLTSILVHGADEMVEKKCKKRKRKYKPNFTQALNRMKNSVVLLFCREEKIVEGYLNELVWLFANNLEVVRKDRHFERNFRKSKRIYPMPYKGSF